MRRPSEARIRCRISCDMYLCICSHWHILPTQKTQSYFAHFFGWLLKALCPESKSSTTLLLRPFIPSCPGKSLRTWGHPLFRGWAASWLWGLQPCSSQSRSCVHSWAPWMPALGCHVFQFTHTCSHCPPTTIAGWLGLKRLTDLAPSPELLAACFELGCPASLPCLFNLHTAMLLFSHSVVSDSLRPHGLQHASLYAEHIMQNSRLCEAQAGIKIVRRNINNLRYADDTTLMAKSEEELKSLLMKWKRRVKKLT